MKKVTYLTHEYKDKRMSVKIVRKEVNNGCFEFLSGEILTDAGKYLDLNLQDVESLINIFKSINEDCGICI